MCKQIVAEARVAKPSGRVTWVRVSKDNYYLDCEALNAAAAHLLAVHMLQPDSPREQAPAKEKKQDPRQAAGKGGGSIGGVVPGSIRTNGGAVP